MNGRHFEALTGLRGFAALWVMGYHYVSRNSLTGVEALSPPFLTGYLGVDLFFVLSGFVLAYNYRDHIRSPAMYGTFLRNRFARIYPAHLVVLCAMGAAVAAGLMAYPALQTKGIDFVRSLLLLEAWRPALNYAWNGPSWSISSEAAAYVCFPLISYLVFRIRSVPFAWTVLLACFALLAWVGDSMYYHHHLGFTAARIGCEFTAGVAAFRLWDLGQRPWTHTTVAILALWIGSYVNDARWSVGNAGTTFPAIAAFIVLGLASGRGLAARVLASNAMQYLGRISYCIYLLHIPVLFAYKTYIPWDWRTLVPATVTTFIVSALLHRYLEEPARRALTRSTSRSEVPAPIQAPAA